MRSLRAAAIVGASLALAVGCTSRADDSSDAVNLSTATDAPDSEKTLTGQEVEPNYATVSEVIDGDTVILDFDGVTESVRLIGIDTPEPRGGIRPPECFGDEASLFTAGLLPEGTQVIVSRDVEPRDVYDRLLGYVHRAEDGLFVNLAIVEAGYAAPLHIDPNGTFATQFAEAAALARSTELGLWGACGGPDVLVAD